MFVTAGLPGGLHVRLVAPFDTRVRRMGERLRVSAAAAAERVHEIDRNRAAFYARYWPGKNVGPETFALTINTAELTESQVVACLVPLILGSGNAEHQSSGGHQREKSTGAARGTGRPPGGSL